MAESDNNGTPDVQSPQPDAVLDGVQLRRIEATHRGFFYQHLYAVGCLLLLAGKESGQVLVERDEDVEVSASGCRYYLQVKTSTTPLALGDISSAVDRFTRLRSEHESGARDGKAAFLIVSNAPPNGPLSKSIASSTWPSDIRVMSPGVENMHSSEIPPVWPDLNSAFEWCKQKAQQIPFAAIHPETLVFKLAARVQYAATGEDPSHPRHVFDRADLPGLFEQLVEQLQDFPSLPHEYRPQDNEPSLDNSAQTSLIVGFSGAGKTAWAANGARHTAASTVYFDVSDLPGPALANSLARELAARFLGTPNQAAALPAASGLEMLRALDARINLSPSPIVVIDNVHRAAPADLRDVIQSCASMRFVLLAQPWPGGGELEALLTTKAQQLDGWTLDTIASVFAEEDSPIDARIAAKWKSLTAGMPLFIRNAASLAKHFYAGDAARFAEDLENADHTAATAQEEILARTTGSLAGPAKQVFAALSYSNVPLTREEIEQLLRPLGSGPAAPILRDFIKRGILQGFVDGRLKVHDALRPLSAEHQATLPPEIALAIQTALRDALFVSFTEGKDLARFGLWLRLLPETGATETLVDIATQEFFHEAGDPHDLKAVLEDAANDPALSDEARFWTLDALIFWDSMSSDYGQQFPSRLDAMEACLISGNLGPREYFAYAMKKIVYFGKQEELAKVEEAFEECLEHISDSPVYTKILTYNYAGALYQCGRYAEAAALAESLTAQYYEDLGLTPVDVIAANPPEIIAKLNRSVADLQDDLKRLADCLDLWAKARRRQHIFPELLGFHAMKFYEISGAYRSAVKAGHDAAEDMLSLGDALGAKQVFDNHVLRVVNGMGLTSLIIPSRSFYAVILAYAGYIDAARKEISALLPYRESLPPLQQKELTDQAALIEDIASGEVQLRARLERIPSPRVREPARVHRKIGRNEPCPCGSGQKFKRCCGP